MMFMKKTFNEICNEIVEMGYYEKTEIFADMTPHELYRFYLKLKKAKRLIDELDVKIADTKEKATNEEGKE